MSIAHSVPRLGIVSGYTPYQSEKLEAEASQFLAKAGFREDGRPKTERSVSVRAISTPCGGKPTWKKGK